MTRDEFLRRLRELVEDLSEEIQDSADRAFVAHVLQSVAGLDRDTAIEAAEVGNGDLGIDGFDKDDDARVVTIVQGKYRPDGGYAVSREEVEDFLGIPDRLLRSPLGRRDEVRAAQLDYREAIQNGYEVRLILAAAGTLSPQAQDELARRRGSLPLGHSLDPVDLEGLHAYFEHSAQQAVTFRVVEEQIFTRDVPRSAIFTAHAVDLARIYTEHGNAIFQLNPRLTLKRSKVNSKILATLRDDEDRLLFWAFNNGVSIVCDDFKHRTNDVLVHNLRIVNGCQTTTALATAFQERLLTDSVHILVRLVVAPPRAGELAEKISERTNRQNAIKARDLISNDEEQRRLEREFATLEYFYERKAGGADALPRPEKRLYRGKMISSEMAGRACLAFIGRPRDAIALSEEELFDDSGPIYQEVYGQPAVQLLVSWYLWEALNTLRKSLKKEFARKPDTAIARILRLLSLKVGRHYILALIGHLIRERYNGRTPAEIWRILSTKWTREQPRQFAYAAATALRGTLADMLPHQDAEYDEIDLRKYLIETTDAASVIAKRQRLVEAGGGVDHVFQLLPPP